MPPRCLIVPAEISHVYLLADRLRPEDADEVRSLGLQPRRALRQAWRAAVMRRTAFAGDDIAAMWGLGGNLCSDIGVPWLLTTPAIERMPVTFLCEARCEVAEMLSLRATLVNHVAASYTRAVRLLEVLGFTIGPPAPFGPRGALFRRFEMRRP